MRRYLILLFLLCVASVFIAPVMATVSPEVVDNMYETGKRLVYAFDEYEEGLWAFNAVLKVEPTHLDSWIGKGVALHQLKRYDEALEAYEKAISLNSTRAGLWSSKGSTLIKLKRYEEAIEALDIALEIDPNYKFALYDKSEALYALGRDAEASELSAKADSIPWK